MADFIKRQNIAFWLCAAAFVLTLVGVILAGVSSGVTGYAMSYLGIILAMGIIAMVLLVARAYLADRFGAQNFIVALVNLVTLVLLCFAFMYVILDRAVLATSQFSFDSVNTVGWMVLYESIVALVMFLVSAVLLIIAGFFKDKRTN